MKLSTRGRYGLRAMVDLAQHDGEGEILLKDVAKRQGVSLKYLEQLITPLRAAGLVRGVRGARGGYRLARNPEDIHLVDILQALEGSLSLAECSDKPEECKRNRSCVTFELWNEIHTAVLSVLAGRNLASLARRQTELERQSAHSLVYEI